jgi:hypothetical protein
MFNNYQHQIVFDLILERTIAHSFFSSLGGDIAHQVINKFLFLYILENKVLIPDPVDGYFLLTDQHQQDEWNQLVEDFYA